MLGKGEIRRGGRRDWRVVNRASTCILSEGMSSDGRDVRDRVISNAVDKGVEGGKRDDFEEIVV